MKVIDSIVVGSIVTLIIISLLIRWMCMKVKKGSKIVEYYALLVFKGHKTIEEVPERFGIRKAVIELLELQSDKEAEAEERREKEAAETEARP